MSETTDNGGLPAFPAVANGFFGGLTKREYIAAKMMSFWLLYVSKKTEADMDLGASEAAARDAVICADALIAALKENPAAPPERAAREEPE